MPQSLILNLVVRSAIPSQHLQGYTLQQLFFDLVDTVDPELGNVLRRDDQNRSYSLSAFQIASEPRAKLASEEPADCPSWIDPSLTDPSLTDKPTSLGNLRLLGSAKTKVSRADKAAVKHQSVSAQVVSLQYGHEQSIPAGAKCWWRVSFLDDDLFDHLIFLWNQLQGEPFPVGAGSVMIQSIEDELPTTAWSSSCSYHDIYEQASARDRDIHLEFLTPTAFEQAGQLTPLPTADAVFHPLRRRWNRHSGLAFAPSLISHIIPTHFNIKTEITQRFRRRSPESIVGCTGQISFRIAGGADPLIIKRINTLANFTRYCGIGCNTRLGMGVVRRRVGPMPLNLQGLRI